MYVFYYKVYIFKWLWSLPVVYYKWQKIKLHKKKKDNKNKGHTQNY